jgi:hypothetical protein
VEPARLALSLNGGRRFPGAVVDLGGYEGKLAAGILLTGLAGGPGDLWLDAAAGVAGITTSKPWSNHNSSGSTTTVRSSAELALLVGWRLRQSRLYVGPAVSVDFIWLDATWQNAEPGGHTYVSRETHVAAAAGIKAGYQYFWARNLFVRGDLTGDVALARDEIKTQSGSPLYSAPKMYLTFALGIGVWF